MSTLIRSWLDAVRIGLRGVAAPDGELTTSHTAQRTVIELRTPVGVVARAEIRPQYGLPAADKQLTLAEARPREPSPGDPADAPLPRATLDVIALHPFAEESLEDARQGKPLVTREAEVTSAPEGSRVFKIAHAVWRELDGVAIEKLYHPAGGYLDWHLGEGEMVSSPAIGAAVIADIERIMRIYGIVEVGQTTPFYLLSFDATGAIDVPAHAWTKGMAWYPEGFEGREEIPSFVVVWHSEGQEPRAVTLVRRELVAHVEARATKQGITLTVRPCTDPYHKGDSVLTDGTVVRNGKSDWKVLHVAGDHALLCDVEADATERVDVRRIEPIQDGSGRFRILDKPAKKGKARKPKVEPIDPDSEGAREIRALHTNAPDVPVEKIVRKRGKSPGSPLAVSTRATIARETYDALPPKVRRQLEEPAPGCPIFWQAVPVETQFDPDILTATIANPAPLAALRKLQQRHAVLRVALQLTEMQGG